MEIHITKEILSILLSTFQNSYHSFINVEPLISFTLVHFQNLFHYAR